MDMYAYYQGYIEALLDLKDKMDDIIAETKRDQEEWLKRQDND